MYCIDDWLDRFNIGERNSMKINNVILSCFVN